jgi:hypothetical protein
MARDEKGVWTVTTPPAVPGCHYYWLMADGFAGNDPSSETLKHLDEFAWVGAFTAAPIASFDVSANRAM